MISMFSNGILTPYERIRHFLYNLKQIRFFGLPKDFEFTGSLRWIDIKHATWSQWLFLARCLWSGEKIPRAVVLVGAWVTEKEWIKSIEWVQ